MIKALVTLLFISINPPDYKEYIREGDAYWESFDNINAVKEYEKAYSLVPYNYDVLFRLVRTYNDAGEECREKHNRDESEKYVNKAVEYAELFKNKFPDSAAVYTYLAMSYGNLAMFRGGKEKVSFAKKIDEYCKKAISISKTDYMPYIIYGIYFRELANLGWIERIFANTFFGGVPEGSFEDSEKMFKKALAINPDIIVAMYQLSKTYRLMGREDEERALLKKLLNIKEVNFRDKYAKEKARRRLAEM